MSTAWQPMTWKVFHMCALFYEENYKDKYIDFFNAFKVIIPCSICRNHFNSNINKEEYSLENNINIDKIFNWTVDLHNLVNKKNHKKIWSYSEAKELYTSMKFDNDLLKFFLFQYIKLNFKKGPEKTENLFKMMRTLPYLNPDKEKRDKLIDFTTKFDINRDNMKSWLIAFCIILKS